MNATKAICGHTITAVGSPGSPARLKSEQALCGECIEHPETFMANTVSVLAAGDKERASYIVEAYAKHNKLKSFEVHHLVQTIKKKAQAAS